MPIIGVIASSVAKAPPATIAYETIASGVVTNTSTTSITISSIPSTYKHLEFRWVGTFQNIYNESDPAYMRFNGDATNGNYSGNYAFNNGGAVYGSSSVNLDSSAYTPSVNSNASFSPLTGGAQITWKIFDYAETNKWKVMYAYGGNNARLASGPQNGFATTTWKNTAAINSITIFTGIAYTTTTHWALYGIKG